MHRLKIAVLSPIHWRTPPRKQGAWELVASTITEELVRRGHDVTLFATSDSITKAHLASVVQRPVLEATTRSDLKMYSAMHTASVFERASEFDIIHNHFDAYPLVFSKLVTTPVVTTVHGFSSPHIQELYLRYNQTAYVSISMADRAHCPDMNWVANIYHGIDMRHFGFSAKALGYYAFLGRVHPTKGTHLAIQAAKKAGVKLKLGVHVDEDDPVVTQYWHEDCLPLIDNVQIINLGEVDPVGRIVLLQGAIATLCPVQWDEPFGLVLVESMACGTPVVAFGRGSIPEVVRDGIGGVVVEPDNMPSFIEAMQTAQGLDRLRVRQYAESTFSIERMVDQYEDVYQQLLR